MLQEASGPINFTTFLNMFGEKLTGEPRPSAGAEVYSEVQALHMKSDLWQRPRSILGPTCVAPHLPSLLPPPSQLGAPPSAPALPPAGHWWPLSPH